MSLPFNLGVGGAMRAAYRFAFEEGYDCVVQVDADGQHDPSDIARLRTALEHADVVVGARFAGVGEYVVRGPRRWAMRLLAATLSRLVGTPLTDPTSGFRMVNSRALALFAFDFPEEYLGDTVEALVLASRARLRIAQVPVAMRERTTGVPSQNAVRSVAYLLRVVTAIVLAVARRAPIVRPGSTVEATTV
jgi:glycosyltransferase involved in cell wall biosynthesis